MKYLVSSTSPLCAYITFLNINVALYLLIKPSSGGSRIFLSLGPQFNTDLYSIALNNTSLHIYLKIDYRLNTLSTSKSFENINS